MELKIAFLVLIPLFATCGESNGYLTLVENSNVDMTSSVIHLGSVENHGLTSSGARYNQGWWSTVFLIIFLLRFVECEENNSTQLSMRFNT